MHAKQSSYLRRIGSGAATRIRSLCKGTGEIAFLGDANAGAIILAGLAVAAPLALAHGLAALASSWLLARLARMADFCLSPGIYVFNPLLTGLAVGHFFSISATSLLLAAGAGMAAFVLTHAAAGVLRQVAALPPLSLSFVLASWCAQLAAAGLSSITPAPPELVLPAGPLLDALAALGYIYFIPDPRFGLVVALLLGRHSPLLLLSALVGIASGAGWMWLLGGEFHMAAAPGFNFALLGMALGASFLIPSWRSLALTGLASLLALLVSLALSRLLGGLPGHALPYNLATLVTLFALGVGASPLLRRTYAATPEDALRSAAAAIRYPGEPRSVMLPVAGDWHVLQGEDGPWTHHGQWRHACDFIICDESGFSHRSDGSRPSDYFAFGQPVLSPVCGVVAALRGDLKDCAIGQVDQGNVWGNYLIVYDERGFYVELSHLQEASIEVAVGQRVVRGARLARVGSSGYSPQPHLHMQVQATPIPGAPSLPFCCIGYHQNGQFVAAGMPLMGSTISSIQVDAGLAHAMTFHPGDRMTFVGAPAGQEEELISIDISLAADGSYCLQRGESRLYVGRDEVRFLAYRLEGDDPALRALFLALPSMPFGQAAGQGWSDWIPAAMCGEGGFLRDLGALFAPRMALARYEASWSGARSVSARLKIGSKTIECLTVMNEYGITYLRAGAFSMHRRLELPADLASRSPATGREAALAAV
jgi:urea transporter